MKHFIPPLQTIHNQASCFVYNLNSPQITHLGIQLALNVKERYVANRRKESDLWTIADMKKVIYYFNMPVSLSEAALQQLRELHLAIVCLSPKERNRLSKLIGLNLQLLIKRRPLDWRINELWTLKKGLELWPEQHLT